MHNNPNIPHKPFEVRKLTKSSTVEKYFMSFERDGCESGWACFLIDDAQGFVCAMTDWGEYQYWWPRHGRKSLKHFLVEINEGYITDKFCGHPKHFYAEETKAKIIKDILQERRTKAIDSDAARDMYDDVVDMEDTASSDVFMFQLPTKVYEELYCNDWSSIPHIVGYTAWQQIFVRRIFPAFQNILRKELDENKIHTDDNKSD
jgi:hypothetical protein